MKGFEKDDFTLSRLIRFSVVAMLIMIMISLIFGTGIASAETGNITAEGISTYSNTYFGSTGSGLTPSIKYIRVDSSTYNTIYTATVQFATPRNWALAQNSDTFTITSGGTGTGSVYYNESDARIYFYFNQPTFTQNFLTLTFDNNIDLEITDFGTATTGSSDVSATKPFALSNSAGSVTYGNCGAACGGTTQVLYNANVATRSTISYDISYPNYGGVQYFNAEITKYTGVSNNVRVHSSTGIYCYVAGSDITSYGCLKPYADGLYLNVSITSSIYNDVLINSTNANLPEEDEDIGHMESNGYGVWYSNTSVIIGGQTSYGWVHDAFVWPGYVNEIIGYKPYRDGDICYAVVDGMCLESLQVSPSSTGQVYFTADRVGLWEIVFTNHLWGFYPSSSDIKDNDSLTVLNEQPTYLSIPMNIITGDQFDVNYTLGFNYVNNPVLELYKYIDVSYQKVDSIYLIGTLGVPKIIPYTIVTGAGAYRFVIAKTVSGDALTTVSFDVRDGYIRPPMDIKTSKLELDRLVYAYGDEFTLSYSIDSINYSRYSKSIEYYDSVTNTSINIHNPTTQTGTYIGQMDSRYFVFPGNDLQLRMLYFNSTMSPFVGATVNFTLGWMDSEGYGLQVISKNVCENKNVTLRSVGTSYHVNVSFPSGNVVSYNLTGNHTFSIPVKEDGNYAVRLVDVSGIIRKIVIFAVLDKTNIICTTPTPATTYKVNGTWIPTEENIAATCGFWDGCVRALFSTQGVNNVTRLLFAISCIVVMMFVGLIVSKGNFGVAVALGLLPYVFFAYMTISSPCGQYMSLWVTIFIGLVIGIKMKWFS